MSHLKITLAVNWCLIKRDMMDRSNVQRVILFIIARFNIICRE